MTRDMKFIRTPNGNYCNLCEYVIEALKRFRNIHTTVFSAPRGERRTALQESH